MKLIWGFVSVPTNYAIYIVNKENGVLKFVKEFSSKPQAINWIAKSGEKGITYCIQTHLQKS